MKNRILLLSVLIIVLASCQKDGEVPEVHRRLSGLIEFDSKNNTTISFEFKYDEKNRLIEIVQSDNSYKSIEYDGSNRPLTMLKNGYNLINSVSYDNWPIVRVTTAGLYDAAEVYEFNEFNDILSRTIIHNNEIYSQIIFWRYGKNLTVTANLYDPLNVYQPIIKVRSYTLTDIESPFKGIHPIILYEFLKWDIYIHPDYLPETRKDYDNKDNLKTSVNITYSLKDNLPESAICVINNYFDNSTFNKEYQFFYEEY